jgi:DNA-binding transcriptional LysR family regulator
MKTRNLTEAARLMYVTQPAVSQALREFETQLGMELFYRGRGQIRPTNEAEILLPDVERVLSHVDSLKSRAMDLQDALGGQIKVAATPILSIYSMPPVVNRMLLDRPRLRIAMQSLATPELMEHVRSEAVELGFTFGPVIDVGVTITPLFETRLVCLMQANHPLAARKRIHTSDTDGERLVVLSAQSPSGFAIRNALQNMDDVSVQIETNSAGVAVEIVRHTGAIAIIDPMTALSKQDDSIVIRPFDPDIKMSAVVVSSRHRSASKIALQFVAHARAVFAAHAGALRALGIEARAL